MRKTSLVVAAIVLAACASSSKPAFVAANNQTVFASTEQGHGPNPVHVIYVENRSTIPILVYGATLRRCENVKQRCDSPQKLNVRIAGGRRAPILRVEPRAENLGFTYSSSFSWQADSSGQVAALSVLADEGVQEARENIAAIERADAARRAEVGGHDDWLSTSSLGALGARAAAIRAEPDSIVMRVGEVVTLDRIRLIALDSAGARLGRVRYSFGFQPGVVAFTRPDTLRAVAAGRVALELRAPIEAQVGRTAPLAPVLVSIIVRP